MKMTVVKKGVRKWTAEKGSTASACCYVIEGSFWPCIISGVAPV